MKNLQMTSWSTAIISSHSSPVGNYTSNPFQPRIFGNYSILCLTGCLWIIGPTTESSMKLTRTAWKKKTRRTRKKRNKKIDILYYIFCSLWWYIRLCQKRNRSCVFIFLAQDFTFRPFSLYILTRGKLIYPLPFLKSFLPIPFVLSAIMPYENTISMHQIFFKLSDISSSILKQQIPSSILHIVFELSLINLSVLP